MPSPDLEDAIIKFWGWQDHILRMTGSHFEDDRITFWGWQDYILRMTGSHFESDRITFCGCRRHIWMLSLSHLDSVFITLEAICIKLWGCSHHIWFLPTHKWMLPSSHWRLPYHMWKLSSSHLKAAKRGYPHSVCGRPPSSHFVASRSHLEAALITFKACTQHICRKFSIHLEAAIIAFGECLVIFRDWPYYIWLKSHHNWRLPISHLEHAWRNVHPRFVPW
jgi:hypothetical protein